MSTSQLLFFFVVLPIIYTVLAVILINVIGSIVKQVKYAEYSVRLTYDREKAKIGQEAVDKYKAGYELAQ